VVDWKLAQLFVVYCITELKEAPVNIFRVLHIDLSIQTRNKIVVVICKNLVPLSFV
jgi:hypothetical protein